MTPLVVALLAFVCICGAGLLGLAIHPAEEYLADQPRETVRFTQGIVASLAALVLSLLIAGATGHFRAQGEQLRAMSAEAMVLHSVLEQYGPEAAGAQAALRRSVEHSIVEIWATPLARARPSNGRGLFSEIAGLEPASPSQVFLKTKALEQLVAMSRARAALATAEQSGAIQTPIVVMLVLWFVALFLTAGLLGHPNGMAIGATVLGSAAVSGALLLVLELDQPFHGVLALSDAPLREVLAVLLRP